MTYTTTGPCPVCKGETAHEYSHTAIKRNDWGGIDSKSHVYVCGCGISRVLDDAPPENAEKHLHKSTNSEYRTKPAVAYCAVCDDVTPHRRRRRNENRRTQQLGSLFLWDCETCGRPVPSRNVWRE